MQFNKAQIIIVAVLLSMVGLLVYLNYKSSTPDVLPTASTAANQPVRSFDFNDYLAGLKDSMSATAWEEIVAKTTLANNP